MGTANVLRICCDKGDRPFSRSDCPCGEVLKVWFDSEDCAAGDPRVQWIVFEVPVLEEFLAGLRQRRNRKAGKNPE